MDALLVYLDGREQHVSVPESRSPIPDPLPTHILLNESGGVLAYMFRGTDFGLPLDPTDVVIMARDYMFRGTDFGLPLDPTDVIMARDPETPDECPVYREMDQSALSTNL